MSYFLLWFPFFPDKSQTYLAFKACKRACLNFVVKFTRSLYLKGSILSMIDKRAVHQLYLISPSVSESMPVLLTPFPGWNPGPAEINSKTSISFTGARIYPLCVIKSSQWQRSCQGFISSQISQGALEELHSFIQETGIFSPFAGVPSKYISILAEMTSNQIWGELSSERPLEKPSHRSFLIWAAMPGIVFMSLPTSTSNQQGFLSLLSKAVSLILLILRNLCLARSWMRSQTIVHGWTTLQCPKR